MLLKQLFGLRGGDERWNVWLLRAYHACILIHRATDIDTYNLNSTPEKKSTPSAKSNTNHLKVRDYS